METFKDRLKDLREEKGLSRRELARQIGMGSPNIGLWEKGIQEPAASTVVKLARFFGVTTDYLLGEEN